MTVPRSRNFSDCRKLGRIPEEGPNSGSKRHVENNCWKENSVVKQLIPKTIGNRKRDCA